MKRNEIKIALDIYLEVYPVFTYVVTDKELIITRDTNTVLCIKDLDNINEIIQIHDSLEIIIVDVLGGTQTRIIRFIGLTSCLEVKFWSSLQSLQDTTLKRKESKIETKINKQTAIKLAKSKFWETMTAKEIAEFQLNTELLCMPFSIFHKAVEEALGRSVWTHEFAFSEGLKKELLGENPAPTMEEIINLIPKDKRVILVVTKGD